MDTSISRHLRLRKFCLGVLSLFAVLAIAFPATGVSHAEAASPFVGRWQATDPADGSDIRLAVSGPPTGPFQITWTESYIGFCSGEAGIVRGMGWLDPNDANRLQASLRVECFASGDYLDFDWEWRYHSFTDTLSTVEGNGVVTVWTHPGHIQDQPAALNLRVNYGDDWVESFYEAGHTVWITVTESDGLTVKASAEAFTGTVEWWDTETGFQTADDSWVPGLPDIAPGDWVFGWVDNGASAQVQIGEITAYFDLTTDTLTGTIAAPWYLGEVEVACFPWPGPEPQPEAQVAVIPNGLSEYSCAWTDLWNIRLRDGVDVTYTGSDGQLVMSGFDVPNGQVLASAFGDWLWLHGFGQQVQVTISVFQDQIPGQFPLWQEERTTNDDGFAQVTSSDFNRDLLPGNYLTVSGPTIKKDLVLVPITVELFDVDEDRMMGTAPPGSEVWVAAGMEESQDGVTVIADATTGWWEADLAGIVDMTDDMRGWSYAQIWDGDADVNEADPRWPVDIWVTSTDDILADDGYCTLREAVIAANTNTSSGGMDGECPAGLDWETDTIILQPDRLYSLTSDSSFEDGALDGDLDIWDNNAPTDLVIKVDGEGPSVISQDAAVDDRVVQNLGARVIIRRLTLTGGANVGAGGGLFNSGTMTLFNSHVNGNTVGWTGGGIFNANLATLTMYGGTIAGNSAPNNRGGGITNEGYLSLDSTQVMGNSALHGGGGIHNSGTLTMNQGNLFGNYSGGGGGGLANMPGAQATIRTGTKVQENTAGTGALFNYGTLVVEGIEISGNRAEYGGGLSNWGGVVRVVGSTVSNNTASASAGGIHNKNGGTVTIEDSSVVTGNTATWDGGGINNWDGTVIIRDSTISANSASQAGGGIFNLAVGTMTVANSVVSGNSAGWGGGGINNEGALTVVGSAILSNSAVYNGDAVRSATGIANNTSITGSCIVGNGSVAVFNTSAATQDATSNWWGDASGPSGTGPGTGDSVGAYIDYSSWLSSAPAICGP